MGVDHVEGAVFPGQVVGGADLEGRVGDSVPRYPASGRLHHLGGRVQALYPTGVAG